MSHAKFKAINSQSEDVFWFLHKENGYKRLVVCGDAQGSGAASHGSVWLNRPPFVVQSVSRSFSAAAGKYVNVNVSPPAVAGYTYLGLVGVRNGIDGQLSMFSFSPGDVGFLNTSSNAISGIITLSLLYGRSGS